MTWFEYYNYGTALQLYAMNRVLTRLGEEPIVIAYHARQIGKGGKYREGIIPKCRRKIKNRIYRNIVNSERDCLFESFLNRNLFFSNECDTLSDLELLNDSLDVFICGSDQIWAPSCFDPHYYLDFVSDNNRMIAYAPSIGLRELENKYVRAEITRLAARFNYISTREEAGSEMLSQLINREVHTVLDPTLLLTKADWEEYLLNQQDNENEICGKKYMLVYMLGTNETYWKQIYTIAKRKGLSVLVVPVFEKDYARKGCLKKPIGPEEFVRLVRDCEYVCTDSFHGTVFSILFEKNFYVFERFRNNDKNNQNMRIYNILTLLDLSDRLVGKRPLDDKEVDFEKVKTILNQKREDSFFFLKSALYGNVEKITENKVKSNNIKNHTSLCCGCGACKCICPVGAIEIVENEEGFLQSIVDENKCISCGKCVKICPYCSAEHGKKCSDGRLYSYKDSASEVLMKSSSGGAAFALSKILIDESYKIVGCEYDYKHGAKHTIVESKDKLGCLQGSKYVQSLFHPALEKVIDEKKVAIIGTPCQIAGARKLLEQVGNDKAVYIDLICHGVPSSYLFEQYKKYLVRKGLEENKIKVLFRYKPKGWTYKYIYSSDSNNIVCQSQSIDPFLTCFEHGICYSKNCYECPWRDKSVADIRLGDYWGPRFENDKTGVSMMLALTEKGEHYVNRMQESAQGYIVEQAFYDYCSFQQTRNENEPLFRAEVIGRLKEGTSISVISKEYAMPYVIRQKIGKITYKLKGFGRRND